jgi:hypothetical protein
VRRDEIEVDLRIGNGNWNLSQAKRKLPSEDPKLAKENLNKNSSKSYCRFLSMNRGKIVPLRCLWRTKSK